MNRNDGAVGDARKRMTPDESTDSVRVAAVLATVMTEADCASPEYPFSDLSRARAILASDWLADVVAQAKAEALYAARDDLYAGCGPDLVADSDIVYGEWLGNRGDQEAATS